MIDEFQDSSEIQFKLALLLADTNNVCVVGDWKQSIYSFQYAAVENITEFESRLDRFVAELNEDHERVSWATRPIIDIELVENYRSTQAILDFSEHSLVTPAASTDAVDETAVRDRIVSLSSKHRAREFSDRGDSTRRRTRGRSDQDSGDRRERRVSGRGRRGPSSARVR